MSKCFICDKDLADAKISAKKDNGDYYLMCSSCGNVHYVRVLNNGLTDVQRTSNEDTEETRAEMLEAAKLFKKAGVNVMEFKVGVHSEKESTKKLNEEALDKDGERLLRESYNRMPEIMKEGKTFEEYREEFLNFKKEVEENPQKIVKELVEKLLTLASKVEDDDNYDDEDCDCENCLGRLFCDECDEDECEEEEYEDEEDESSLEEVLRGSLPAFLVEGINEDGRPVIAEAANEDDLVEILSDAEEEDIEIVKIHQVNLSLSPVEVQKTSSYRIKR